MYRVGMLEPEAVQPVVVTELIDERDVGDEVHRRRSFALAIDEVNPDASSCSRWYLVLPAVLRPQVPHHRSCAHVFTSRVPPSAPITQNTNEKRNGFRADIGDFQVRNDLHARHCSAARKTPKKRVAPWVHNRNHRFGWHGGTGATAKPVSHPFAHRDYLVQHAERIRRDADGGTGYGDESGDCCKVHDLAPLSILSQESHRAIDALAYPFQRGLHRSQPPQL